jgi:hypothetical protein
MEEATGEATPATIEARVDAVRLRDGVAFCAVVFATVRVTLSLLAVVTVGAVHPPSSAGSGVAVPATAGWHNAIDGTDRWDAGWFEGIARDGYRPDDASAPSSPATRWPSGASVLPLSETDASLVVSNLAFLGALIVLFALTTFEFSIDTARRTVLLLALFPVSFFFLSPYSESMFLLASLLTFWWARRGRWGPAAAGGFVAALTRSVGVLLVPALLLEAWSIDPRERPRAIVASLVPLLAPSPMPPTGSRAPAMPFGRSTRKIPGSVRWSYRSSRWGTVCGSESPASRIDEASTGASTWLSPRWC